MKRSLSSCLSAAMLTLPLALAVSNGSAQEIDAETMAKVQALHDEAVAALDANDFATACPKLERVIRIVPHALGARMSLAECYKGAGKLASAWSEYVTVADVALKAGQQKRSKEATEKSAALRPRLAELTIVVPESMKRLPGLLIRRGANEIAPKHWGVPLPVDVGPHVLIVTAIGKRRWEKSFLVEIDGTSVSVNVPTLEDEQPAAPTSKPKLTVGVAPKPPPRTRVEENDPGASWEAQRFAGAVALGVGGMAVGLGAFFGVRAISKKYESNANAHCNEKNQCDEEGLMLRDEGYSAGTVSTVMFVVGGAALGGGAALVLTAPRRRRLEGTTAEVAVSPQGISLRGMW